MKAFFLIYKVFTKYKTIETIAKIDDSVFTINLDKDTIEAGETIKIETTKYKENVTLISSNPEIIKTEGDTIIGVAEGEATIYASYNEEKSNELTLKCIFNLNEIVLDNSELEIVIGGEQKIIATLVPENSTYKELNWQSSDNSIATVEDGLVKGCKEGRKGHIQGRRIVKWFWSSSHNWSDTGYITPDNGCFGKGFPRLGRKPLGIG